MALESTNKFLHSKILDKLPILAFMFHLKRNKYKSNDCRCNKVCSIDLLLPSVSDFFHIGLQLLLLWELKTSSMLDDHRLNNL